MMLIASLFGLVLIGLAVVLIGPVAFRLLQRLPVDDISPEWLAGFTVSTYYPMEHLLARDDFQFLVRQPGFDFSLYRKLRRERMLIFRQYLRRLIADFNKLHAVARYLISRAEKDQSELLVRLIRINVRFTFSILRAEMSYYLCRVGIGSLAAHAAISRLEEMSLELGRLSRPDFA